MVARIILAVDPVEGRDPSWAGFCNLFDEELSTYLHIQYLEVAINMVTEMMK